MQKNEKSKFLSKIHRYLFLSKKRKKKDYDFLTIIIFHESTGVRQLAAALATKRRPIEPIPAPPPLSLLRNPFKRRKSLSHLITGPGSELTDVLTFTPSLVQISPPRAASPPTSTLIRIHGYHFMPDLMSRIN